MTDKQFQKELNKLAIKNAKYKHQLNLVEEEIKRRYGKYPSEVDCDSFIDAFHVGCAPMRVNQIDEDMNMHIEINKK